jgi:hypothetical protein
MLFNVGLLYFLIAGVQKVSDHGTIGPRKYYEFPQKKFPPERKIRLYIVKIEVKEKELF